MKYKTSIIILRKRPLLKNKDFLLKVKLAKELNLNTKSVR